MVTPRLIRIFLSSPGDVADERALALKVIDELAYDPLLRGKVVFDVVAWDKPGADAPMLVTLTPQEAINQQLATPAACDIVIVIFWSRMGTPLPHPEYQKPDDSPYLSGTEWEFEDARQAALKTGKPYVVVYRRMEEPVIGLRDTQRAAKIEQWERVETFFTQFTDAETGAIYGGINPYEQPDDFRDKLETHLKALIQRILEAPEVATVAAPEAEAPLWTGSPFPGLRAFTSADAPIFFGRGAETDALIERLQDDAPRFIAVVGASGSGKSSLVGAGLIPRLLDNAIAGSRDWQWIRFTPGSARSGDPFAALGNALRASFPIGESVIGQLPDNLEPIVTEVLQDAPQWAELVVVIDQFEELFSLVTPRFVEPFIDFLVSASQTPRLRVVATLRADFYAACVEHHGLAALLKTGTFPLSAPGSGALYEMITRPAARAGVAYEEGLAQRILDDTGNDPGALALLAYTLDELYRVSQDDRILNISDYEALGGVQGAIGERAENIFQRLDAAAQATLPTVFQELAEVDERGIAIRSRALHSRVASTEAAAQLVDALTDARLLVQSRGEIDEPVVEVAHEALLRGWGRLAQWIDETQDVLKLRRQVRIGAEEWERNTRHEDFLLRGIQLVRVRQSIKHEGLSQSEQTFIEASEVHEAYLINQEEQRKRELQEAAERAEQASQQAAQTAEHAERAQSRARRITRWAGVAIGVLLIVAVGAGALTMNANNQSNAVQTERELLVLEQGRIGTLASGGAVVGDVRGTQSPDDFRATVTAIAVLNAWQPVIQDFDGVEMVQVPAGCFYMGSILELDEQPVHEQCFDEPFWFDRYEVTNAQYGSIGCEDTSSRPNQPRNCVDWYDAQAHCESRGARLPTEAEWEYAARGPDSLVYPWGNEFVGENVVYLRNASEMAVVGSRPAGASWVGAMDMSGNVWEWVSTIHDNGEFTGEFPYPYNPIDGREDRERTDGLRVLRGGGWNYIVGFLRVASRFRNVPENGDIDLGFRCARS